MRFGLIANLSRPGTDQAIDTLIEWSQNSGSEIVLCEDLSVRHWRGLDMASPDTLAAEVDMLVSMGGDGTFLSAARAAAPAGKPVLGINIGSLGFLTQLRLDQMIAALNAIIRNEYGIEPRMLLHAEIAGKSSLACQYALNDVVIDNGPIARLIDINLSVNGREVVTYRADGLVLATPTGSTAYNLAAGGPIMHPTMLAVVATPISAFSLTTRPMIFRSTDHLELRIHSPHEVAGLTLDGQVSAPLTNDDVVKVTGAEFALKLVTFPTQSFYEVLKRKLHWGVSPHDREP